MAAKATKTKGSRVARAAKAVKTKTVSRKATGDTAPGLAARVRALERQLLELQKHPLFALAGVLDVARDGRCATLRVTGNLQVVNGSGRTDITNGCGNLIIGYNETSFVSPQPRTGSHNLIVGRYHGHASYAGVIAGEQNFTTARAPASCVLGGSEGHVEAPQAVVLGGVENNGNSQGCVIVGGRDNGANAANHSVVVGGVNNRTAASDSSIFGGSVNTANAPGSTILGGQSLTTTTPGQRIP